MENESLKSLAGFLNDINIAGKVSVHAICSKKGNRITFDWETWCLQGAEASSKTPEGHVRSFFPESVLGCWITLMQSRLWGCRGRGRPDDSSWHYYRSKLTSATFHSTRVTVCGLCMCHLWYRRTLSQAWNVRLNTVHHDINYLALKPS